VPDIAVWKILVDAALLMLLGMLWAAPTPIEPNAPAFPTAAAMAGDDTPAIGACTIGSSISSNASSVCGDRDCRLASSCEPNIDIGALLIHPWTILRE
jgi:hypothetical protein